MKRQRRKEVRKAPERPFKRRWQSWYEGKVPLVHFCLKFFGLLVLLYALSFTPVCRRALDALPAGNARLASVILNWLGEGTQAAGLTIFSAKYAIAVLPECSATEFLLFFCATVLAFPSRMGRKILGIFVGVAVLLFLNQLRIVSLYYVGAHFPKYFDTTHEELWGILLISAEIVLCAAWIGWARESEPPELDATT
jgi:exosortase H (IPTLxxWG-CTERM-specific)